MKNSRRNFVKASAVVGATLPVLTSSAAKKVTPGKKFNHASLGANGKAWSDIKQLMRGGHANLIAVAEVDETRTNKVREAYPDARIYKDWRELLKKEHKNLSSINVSTPDHMHAPMVMTALNLGLHVYGQKPVAHDLYETRKIALAAKKSGLITQMGNQLASSTYERLAHKIVQDGVIGKIKEIHMMCYKTWGDPKPRPNKKDPVPSTLDWDGWCGAGPKVPYIKGYYHPSNWRKRLAYGTGTLGDMGCHIFSNMFGALGFRHPISVTSLGGKPNKYNWAINEKFEYIFKGNDRTEKETIKVTWYDGSLRPPKNIAKLVGGKLPKTGTIFVGTKGALLAEHGKLPKPFPRKKFEKYHYPKIPPRDHYLDFMKAVAGEDIKLISDFYDYGCPLTETVLLGALASHFPKVTLEWDAAKLQFTNSPDANKLIRQKYRAGWEVKGLT